MAESTGERVVALLVNFRRAAPTLACLRALRAGADCRVVLLDNGSGEAEESALREGVAGDVQVDLLLLGGNLGYCAAVNRGLARARGMGAAYALLLNNDVVVEDGFLGPMVEVLDHDPAVAGVAPTILRPDGRVWSQGARVRCGPNLTELCGQGANPAPRSRGPQAAGYLTGACALYRLDALAAVGDLDEGYFMYLEDAALGDALRARGGKLVWLPWVRVVHDAGGSSGGGRSPLRKYLMAVNSLRYLRARGSVSLWLAFALFDVLLLPLAYAGGWRAGWAKTAGLLDGLRGHRAGAADVERWVGRTRQWEPAPPAGNMPPAP